MSPVAVRRRGGPPTAFRTSYNRTTSTWQEIAVTFDPAACGPAAPRPWSAVVIPMDHAGRNRRSPAR